MPLTPVEILHREFRRSLRGYAPADVKSFLRELAQVVEQLLLENSQLKQEVEHLRERLGYYENLEETIQNALVLAQKTAEEMKSSAQHQAEWIISEAEARAQRIVDDAVRKASEVRSQISELVQERERAVAELKALLEMLLELLERRKREWEQSETQGSEAEATEPMEPPLERKPGIEERPPIRLAADVNPDSDAQDETIADGVS
ncbi:MAG TPA: DivIVA domain-containing protein [Armatimonadetes bacterium]|nr:DivIVA domain-containing protein [Armatimonadota bacterium]